MVLLLFFFDHRGLSCRDVNGGRRGAFDVVGRLEWTNQSEGATPTNQRRDNGAVSSGLGSPRRLPGFYRVFFVRMKRRTTTARPMTKEQR